MLLLRRSGYRCRLEAALPERISEFGAVADAARDAHPARRPHEVRILLLDRRTLLGECLAGALTAEWPALEVETATVNEIGRYREGGFDLCLVLVASDGAAGA